MKITFKNFVSKHKFDCLKINLTKLYIPKFPFLKIIISTITNKLHTLNLPFTYLLKFLDHLDHLVI